MRDDRFTPPNSTLSSSREKTRAWQRSGKPPERKTGLKAIGRRGKRQRREGELFGPLAEMMRMLPCDICGAPKPSDPHHVRSRGAGFVD